MRFFITALTAFTSLAAIASAAPGASDKSVPAAIPSATGAPQLSSSTNPITCPLGDKVLKAGTKFEITWLVVAYSLLLSAMFSYSSAVDGAVFRPLKLAPLAI